MNIPGFQMIKQLGQGGFGSVFQFQDVRNLRNFAVKVVGLEMEELTFANLNRLSPTLFTHCLYQPSCDTHNVGFF